MYDLEGNYKEGYELRFGLANLPLDKVYVVDDKLYYFKMKAHLIYELGDTIRRYAVPVEDYYELINYDEQIEGLSLKHDDKQWSIERN